MDPELDLHSFPILVVDDEQDNLDAFRFNFRKQFSVHTATSGMAALEQLQSLETAVIITDQRMPGMTGIEFLKRAAPLRPDAVGLIVTAFTDVDVLMDAVNLGQVYRYILKPWDSREMRIVLRQAVERYYLRRENQRLTDQLRQYIGYLDSQAHGAFDFGAIVGNSAALQQVLTRVEQVASTASTVLLLGETGTGKEMVARAIHLNSDRADHPFVAVNCAALPGELLESELFGHEKGSFSGALAQRKGRFELADRGTLFLDEVGDLSLEVQVKLLRVLQEREFERIGGTSTIKVDVRVISATHRDLLSMVEGGTFRQDLYYRLNVFPLELPPLRERGEDVLLLAEHFLEKFARQNRRSPFVLSSDASAALMSNAWPGNVRELQNVLERAAIVAGQEEINLTHLDFGRRPTGPMPRFPAGPTRAPAAAIAPLRTRLQDEEKASITRAIEGSSGNIAAAARVLGINRSTLYFRIKKFGMDHLLPTQGV
jgi:DNA-binding NtrC family response regulator